MKIIFFFTLLAFLSSCWPKPRIGEYYDNYKKVMGWKPVYGADTAYKKLSFFGTPQPIEKAGKIYVKDNTIYQNDIGKGIHIIDNNDPQRAQRIAFIKLPGNTDIAAKGNFLYLNNYSDLVVVDVSNRNRPTEVKRIKNMFSTYNSTKPYVWQAPPDSGFYECPRLYNDSVIIRWNRDSVLNQCYKN